ncbi:hypothetical protein GIB67_025116 [Kingdonia uniflora]|uniref:Anthocyanin acyltransferase n=1 Tax=Kingdonia uniflora TaxID=39325 RepID=A0A7J7N884_9MAGN|nr:hypothetical protein GIB67_025116 [Kingdonia uniflora]
MLSQMESPQASSSSVGRRFVVTNKEDLLQEDGVVVAAEIIGEGIQNLRAKGVLDGFQNDLATSFSILPENLFIVMGSPKLGVYETDLGWGRPKKVEVASIDFTKVISLSERGDGEIGLEVGLILTKGKIDVFEANFEATLKTCWM